MIEKSLGFQVFDIITVLSCIISIIAIIFSIASWRYSKKRSKIETSIKFTEMFKELLDDITFITNVLNAHDKIIKLINKVDFNKVSLFNKKELEKFYDESELKELHDFFSGITMNSGVVLSAYFFYNANVLENPPTIPKGELGKDLLKSLFSRKVCESLNSLEYFSIAFVQNIASDKVVYQSLHQSFFHIVKSLYYFICTSNDKEADKYYTNLIELFNMWSEKEKKYLNKEDKYRRKLEKVENKMKNNLRIKPKKSLKR